MITNLLLVCFLGFAVILWGHYGLFSAFQHLVVTIACGALAFAIWEPLVLGVLIDRMPSFAWGVGLLAPFILATLGMRALQDKLVRVNMRFENMANIIGGGFCGLLIGILTAGLVIIGVGMLPIGNSVIDYAPITVQSNGKMTGSAGSGLVLPVDRWTGRFFSSLSRGAFSPTGGQPLGSYRPAVEEMAILTRQHPDPHASTVAQPESVKVNVVTRFTRSDIDNFTDKSIAEPQDLLLISTVWNAAAGTATYDRDGGLRIAPAQVRLQVSDDANPDDDVPLQAPMGVYVKGTGPTRFSHGRAVAYTKMRSEAQVIWGFRIGPNEKPLRLFIRHLRIDPLPEWDHGEKSRYEKYAKALLGREAPPDISDAKTPGGPPADMNIGEGSGATRSGGATGIDVTVSALLPKPLSMHHVHQHELQGQDIYDGSGEVKLPTNTSRNTRIKAIYTAADEYMVRVQVSRSRAFSLFGQAKQFAAGVGSVYIQDTTGHNHHPIGYAWWKVQENMMKVVVNRVANIRSVKELPMRDMRPKDELYIYFSLPRGVDPRKIAFSESEQDVTGIQSP